VVALGAWLVMVSCLMGGLAGHGLMSHGWPGWVSGWSWSHVSWVVCLVITSCLMCGLAGCLAGYGVVIVSCLVGGLAGCLAGHSLMSHG